MIRIDKLLEKSTYYDLKIDILVAMVTVYQHILSSKWLPDHNNQFVYLESPNLEELHMKI